MNDKVYKFATLSLQIIHLVLVMLLVSGNYKLLKLHELPLVDEDSKPFVCFPADAIDDGE